MARLLVVTCVVLLSGCSSDGGVVDEVVENGIRPASLGTVTADVGHSEPDGTDRTIFLTVAGTPVQVQDVVAARMRSAGFGEPEAQPDSAAPNAPTVQTWSGESALKGTSVSARYVPAGSTMNGTTVPPGLTGVELLVMG